MKRTSTFIYRWLSLVVFLAMVVVNILANAIPIGGQDTGEISAKYINLFTPAGITFSIWGAIYILLAVGWIMNIFSKNETADAQIDKIGPWFMFSCILNILWILLWHYGQITISTIVIILLCINMFILLSRMNEHGVLYWGIGIYTGWISVASIASLFVLGNSWGFNGTSTFAQVIAIIAIIAASVILGMITSKLSCAPLGIAVLWALCGILVKHITDFKANYNLVITSVIIGIIIIVCFLIKTLKLRLR